MAEQPDKELWERVRRGDAETFGVMFDRYADDVYNYCFRRTGDWAAAEDLVGAVFLRAWSRRADLEITSHDERLLPWLLGVATNLLRRHNRSAARFARAISRLNPREHERDFADESIERLADAERMRGVLATVRVLAKGDRDVLALNVWAGLSYEETAAALGIPIGTVRSRLARARKRLESFERERRFAPEREVTNDA